MKSFEAQNAVLDMVPLAEAVLCMDCERISQQRSGHDCAGCGSPNLMNLAAVLNRGCDENAIRLTSTTTWDA